jgi:hypothetical protein
MQNHTHRLQSSLIHQNKVTMRPYLHDVICKITQTHITVMIDTSEQGYNAAISSWRDMQNHTHTSILLTGCRSCSQVVDLAARGHWISSKSVDGLENWFLACNETTKLTSLTCTFGLQEHSASGRRKHRKNNDHWTQDEGLFILKTMIIGHKMKLFILMPGGSGLPSLDTTMRKDYVTRIILAVVLEGWAIQSPPITRILLAIERSRRRKKREKQKLAPYKIYSLRHS